MPRLTGAAGAIVVVLGLASALAGARGLRALEGYASKERCDELQARYVSLLVKQLEPEANAARRLELTRELEDRWTDRDRCRHTVTPSEAACAVAAPTIDDIERCMR